MDDTKPRWGLRIWKGSKVAFWLLIGYVVLMQFLAPNRLESVRADLLDQFQEQRKSRDPQIGDMPAASIVRMVEMKKPSNVGDEMLVLADIAQKARLQTVTFVAEVLLKHLPKDKAAGIATVLSDGRFTHDFPIMVETARQLGLPVSTNMPPSIYALMDLYPQSGSGRPSVLYVPLRRLGGDGPGRAGSPARQSNQP